MHPLGSLVSYDDEVVEPLARVAARQGLDPLAQKLGVLRDFLQDDLAALEEAIAEVDTESLPGTRVRRAAEHLLSSAGKRIRPMCVMLSARLGGRQLDAPLRDLAVACELVHAATLLHDDVIDDSHERRGAPAARVLYGNSASILAGDHLLIHALQRVLTVGNVGLLDDLLNVIRRMVAAEALQLERRGRFDPSRQVYLEVIRGKTAALFGWGLRAGATLANLPPAALDPLERAGLHLGTAFQLVDDVLDFDGDPQTTGKEALVDIREGKLTWPLILAAERDPALQQTLADMAQHAQDDDIDPERIVLVVQKLNATGALRDTRAFAKQEAHLACRELGALPISAARSALETVVETAVHRIH